MNQWRSLSLFCVAVRAVLAPAQDPFYRAFTVEDGLPSDQVYCALQDHEGFMWFGTDAGVSRFDGSEFLNIGPADGLTDNEVLGVREDSQHRIWFLTLNGMLCYWKDGHIINGGTDPDLRDYHGETGWTSFAEDDEGRLWFAGIRGEVVRIDPDGDDDLRIEGDGSFLSVARDTAGHILCANSLGISVFQQGGFTAVPGAPRTYLLNMLSQPSGRDAGPQFLGHDRIWSISAAGPRAVPGSEGRVDAMLHRSSQSDGMGNIWLYRKDAGVDLLRPTKGGFMPTVREFAHTRVNTVCITPNGDRWYCTTSAGVLLVDHEVTGRTEWHRSDRNTGEAFISMTELDGEIWVGTDRGSVHHYSHGKLDKVFQETGEQLVGRILRIRGVDRTIWLASDYGLFRCERADKLIADIVPAYEVIAGLPGKRDGSSNATKNLCVAPDGTLWTSGYGLWKLVERDGQSIRERIMEDRLTRERIYCLHADKEGNVWMDAGASIASLMDDSLVEYTLSEELAGSRITDITTCSGDTLALATAGSGVLLWKKGEVIATIGTAQGLASMMVRRVQRYGDTLWCATAEGLSALVMDRGRVRESWTWAAQQGMPTSSVHDMVVLGERLFMGTSMGLCVAPIRSLGMGREPPRLRMARVVVNDLVVRDMEGPIRLRVEDRILLEVHAIEFAHADQVEYAYSLDGSTVWYPSLSGRVLLDQLAEGDRQVHVRARFPGGAWTPELVLDLEVVPLWWASSTARAGGLFAALAILLFGVFYWSKRSYRRKLKVARQRAIVDEERRRIAADVHDDLGADLSRVLMHARQLESTASVGRGPKVSEGIVATIDKIDEIIWSLDPKRDTLQSTINFIEQQAREMAEAHGLKFRTQVDMPEHDVALDAHQRRELMLIAREAMRNVVKHAQATTLRVDWHIGRDRITLAVEDDGKGIPSANNGIGRHGLANMRERAERLGGTLELGSVEPSGTRVEATIAVDAYHPIG